MLKFTKQDAIIALLVVNLFANVMEISFERETPETLTNNANQFAVFDFKEAIESTVDKNDIRKAKTAEEAQAIIETASNKASEWLVNNLHKHCAAPCLVFKKEDVMGDFVNLNEIYANEVKRGDKNAD